MAPADLSAAEARRIAIAAQGFTDRRPSGRVDRRHLRRVFDRVNVIQVDSVNVLVRSQELPLFARLGPHPRTMLADAIDAGELWEYWAHVAAIVPSSQHRLFRWRMDGDGGWRSVARRAAERPQLVEEVRRRIRDEGPIVAGDLGQRVGPKGSWWSWDDGKVVLEHLFQRGQVVAVRRRRDFARLYDLPERVLPADVLATPTPTEREARKELFAIAAASLGVATLEDLADYHRQWRPQSLRPLVAELVEDGVLRTVTVEGWTKPAYLHRDVAAAAPRRRVRAAQPVRLARLGPLPYRAALRLPLPDRDLHPGARSDATATTCCRTCSATGSSAGSTSRPTALPACCACRARTWSTASTRATSPSRCSASCGRWRHGWSSTRSRARIVVGSPRRCAGPACRAWSRTCRREPVRPERGRGRVVGVAA